MKINQIVDTFSESWLKQKRSLQGHLRDAGYGLGGRSRDAGYDLPGIYDDLLSNDFSLTGGHVTWRES